MKTKLLVQHLFLALVLAVASLGCKSSKSGVTHIPPGGTGAGSGSNPNLSEGVKPGDGSNTAGTATGENAAFVEGNNHPGWPEDRATLAADTVHFDYDSSTIRASERPKVQAVADYLKANNGNAVKIEGHCDERGTDEYNRSLGVRRATAVRAELVSLGIEAGRIDTISFGRDKPADTGHSEAAHSKNRRGEFVVLTPPAK
jgi:peptidoglycan-associated lipoprotein